MASTSRFLSILTLTNLLSITTAHIDVSVSNGGKHKFSRVDDFADSSSSSLDKTSFNLPNILFILADDLGWANVGFHNDENPQIRTPNIDSLATNGLQLNRMYVYRGCAPSRSSFQTGRLPVHVSTDNGDGITNPAHGIPPEMTLFPSKLKEKGYDTHLIGKWDAGFASVDQLPINRGYDAFYGYLGKTIDYFSKEAINDCPNLGDLDLWKDDNPAYNSVDEVDEEYIEFTFRDKLLDALDDYDRNKKNYNRAPFMMLYSSHLPHYPSMVPQDKLESDVTGISDESHCSAMTDAVYPGYEETVEGIQCRTTFQSQVNILDEIVGEIVDKLKYNGLWDSTLLIFQSDNGGSVQLDSSAGNNYPLRGGKLTDFEGGVRAVTVVSGGYLPESRRGQIENGMMHIADWYSTFCSLAGMVTFEHADKKATNAGLPDIDSINMWPLISGEVTESPRTELVLSDHTAIFGDYKLFTGINNYAIWQSPVWPDGEIDPDTKSSALDCKSSGCLFNIMEDPSEEHDLAPEEGQMVYQLKQRFDELAANFYENDRVDEDSCPPGATRKTKIGGVAVELGCGCWMAMHFYDMFDGPYQGFDYNEAVELKEAEAAQLENDETESEDDAYAAGSIGDESNDDKQDEDASVEIEGDSKTQEIPVEPVIPGVVPDEDLEENGEKEIEADDDLEDLLDGDAKIDHELQWWGILLIVLSSLICVSAISVLTYKCYAHKADVLDKLSEYKSRFGEYRYTLVNRDSDHINYETFCPNSPEEEKPVPPAFSCQKISL